MNIYITPSMLSNFLSAEESQYLISNYFEMVEKDSLSVFLLHILKDENFERLERIFSVKLNKIIISSFPDILPNFTEKTPRTKLQKKTSQDSNPEKQASFTQSLYKRFSFFKRNKDTNKGGKELFSKFGKSTMKSWSNRTHKLIMKTLLMLHYGSNKGILTEEFVTHHYYYKISRNCSFPFDRRLIKLSPSPEFKRKSVKLSLDIEALDQPNFQGLNPYDFPTSPLATQLIINKGNEEAKREVKEREDSIKEDFTSDNVLKGSLIQGRQFLDCKISVCNKCILLLLNNTIKEIFLKNIIVIQAKRYCLQYTAIEIFTCKRSYFLVFNDCKERNLTFRYIIRQLFPKERCTFPPLRNQIVFIAFWKLGIPELDNEGYEVCKGINLNFSIETATIIQNNWKSGKMSNLKFLLFLNFLAGRSNEDLSQYPIMPWIIKNFRGETLNYYDLNVLRDLRCPVGALNENRIKAAKMRFNSSKEESSLPPFHHGSHYSAPIIALYYMVRLMPYSKMAKTLQGGKFDISDRLFHTLDDTWESAVTQDCKEIIPELYTTPEIFLNLNKFDLGKTQTEYCVNDVNLPLWCNKNPRFFISLHRKALESPLISSYLSSWVDLIFGFKQTGKHAVEAINVYFYLTYENTINLDHIEDKITKEAIIDQISEFGQTPKQLFRTPCPQKKNDNVGIPIISHPNIINSLSIHNISSLSSRKSSRKSFFSFRSNESFDFAIPLYCKKGENLKNWKFYISCKLEIETPFRNSFLIFHSIDNNSYIRGYSNGLVTVSYENDGPIQSFLFGSTNKINYIDFCHNFRILCVCNVEGEVFLWDFNKLECYKIIQVNEKPLHSKFVESNGDFIIVTKSAVRLFNINGSLIAKLNSIHDGLDEIFCAEIIENKYNCEDFYLITSHSNQRIIFWILVPNEIIIDSKKRGDCPYFHSYCHSFSQNEITSYEFKIIASTKLDTNSKLKRIWCSSDQKYLMGNLDDNSIISWKSELYEEVIKKCSVCSSAKAFDFREICISCYLPYCTSCVEEKVD